MDNSKDYEKTEYLDERSPPPNDHAVDWELEQENPRLKKIKRKVDLRLSLILALMYIVNQIDRTNLPMA